MYARNETNIFSYDTVAVEMENSSKLTYGI